MHIVGTASRSMNLKIICRLDAPNAFAASIIPGVTDLRLPSKILATKGHATSTSGNNAAFTPIEVPITARVMGRIVTARIRNGNERSIFTIIFSTR